jgi:hypothetical protein
MRRKEIKIRLEVEERRRKKAMERRLGGNKVRQENERKKVEV